MRAYPETSPSIQYENYGGNTPGAWRIHIRSSAMRQLLCFVAFSESPSEATWLENLSVFGSHFPSRQVSPLGLKIFLFLGRIFRVAK
jgi:hypothetical protein